MPAAHAIENVARRPGAARSEKSRLAILQAASELIAINGYEHLTIEGIAARAKVGKPTIYRWWASKSELIIECLIDDTLMPDSFRPKSSHDVVADLTDWFLAIIQFVHDDRNAGLIRSLIAAAVDSPEIAAQLSGRLGATPESLGGRLHDAVASGQLAPDTAVAHISELLIGAIILRVVSVTPLEDRDASLFVRTVLAGSLPAG
jgi:AcrR family transcriptional regulator